MFLAQQIDILEQLQHFLYFGLQHLFDVFAELRVQIGFSVCFPPAFEVLSGNPLAGLYIFAFCHEY